MSARKPGDEPVGRPMRRPHITRTGLQETLHEKLGRQTKNATTSPVCGRLGLAIALLLTGCGGGSSYGGSSYGGPPATYRIGGTIMGLTATGLVLANGTDTVSPAAGATSFTFATALTSGSSYAVTVKTQPNSELCQVANGSGQVGSVAVTNVIVTCKAATYTIGGTITGLSATGLVLVNGADTVSPAAGAASFTFATALTSGS